MNLLTPLVRPTHVHLEASSKCQLRCPSCPTATKAIDPAIGSGVLKLDDFRRFLEDNPYVEIIELSNYGEVFLNPELLEILQLGREKGIKLRIGNGVNLNHVSDEILEAVVTSGVEVLSCSIDGASQETYEQYRVRGNFDRVFGHIKKLNHFKQLHASSTPRLIWQFIVFGHNEHEIPLARDMAAELGMEIIFKLNWDASYSPMRNVAWVLKETRLPAASRQAYFEQTGEDYKQGICQQLWHEPQINWNGKNLGCSRNFWGDFGGNAFTDGLLAVANNSKIRYAREMLTGRKPPRIDIPCTTCDIYQKMRSGKKWMATEQMPHYATLKRNVDLLFKGILGRWNRRRSSKMRTAQETQLPRRAF